MFHRVLLSLCLFGLGIPTGVQGACGSWLARYSGLNAIAPPIKISELLDQNLDALKAREQLKQTIFRLRQLRVLSKPQARELIQFLQTSSSAFLDPQFSQNIYGKDWNQLKIRDAYFKLEQLRLANFDEKFDQLKVRDWPRGTRTLFRAARLTTGFLIAAVLLGGLSSIFSRAGAPIVDYAAAWMNQQAFSFSPSNENHPASVLSSFEAEKSGQLDSQYGVTNKHWTPVQQAAGNRVSYFESTLLNADIDLSVNALLEAQTGVLNPEKRLAILRQLQTNRIRFSDVLATEEGRYARELYLRIQLQFDPEKQILKDSAIDSGTPANDEENSDRSK